MSDTVKLIIEIPEELYRACKEYADEKSEDDALFLELIAIANGTPLDDVTAENKGEFDGMNNGEVMNLVLRKTFPRTIFIRGIDEYNKIKSIVYSEEWENAPYQKGGE